MIYFLPAIISGSVLCPDDGILQNVPFRVAAAQIIRSGYLPLWDPYIFSGMPFLAAAQAGVLFPLNWFYLIFSPAVATNLMVISSYMIAALGAYLYARRTQASLAGAIVTSLTWQCSGFLIGQISHINIVQTAALLPWVLWALEGYAVSGRRKWGALIAALIALQAFAGHQQAFVYSFLLVAAYAVVMASAEIQQRKRYLLSLGFTAAGVLLSAVQIVPTLELQRNSLRASATYDFFTSYSMPPQFLLTYLAPYVLGGGDGRLFRIPYLSQPFYVEYVGYAGVLAIVLAIVAVLLKRDARTMFWAISAMICFVLALGGYAPLHLYRLIYYVPVLNLFRVPARHLMEVDFAIAVLAGRGLTALAGKRRDKRTLRIVTVVAGLVLLLTYLIVTWWRPADLRLGREAPVSLMRAPELFLPVLIAGVSAFVLWYFTRHPRGASTWLIAVLAIDLVLWGQSSGWYVSIRKSTIDVWHDAEILRVLRTAAPKDPASYRILTVGHPFDAATGPLPPSLSPEWSVWVQPNVYMMHGIQNAAGYDGFGVARYSKLAGDMKLWGELTDPDAALHSESREIDLLNARYLLSMRKVDPAASVVKNLGVEAFPSATEQYGAFMFAPNDLALPGVMTGKPLRFRVPPVKSDYIALVTNLSWAEDVPDEMVVARLRLTARDGRNFDLALRAGADTADWAYDRPDISARIKHKRATVATSYKVRDARHSYEGHTYITSIALPEKLTIVGGEIALEPTIRSPDLVLDVFRVSLVNSEEKKSNPLKREWFRIESQSTQSASDNSKSDRWTLVAQTDQVEVYENARALPRVWMASEAIAMNEGSLLQVIRTGRLPDGSKWNPLQTVLLEAGLSRSLEPAARDAGAKIVRYEPNRIDLTADSNGNSVLVLSETAYPGWRVYVDGQVAELLRVNYDLRGVLIPAGSHHVSFVYRPWSAMIGLLVSALSVIGLMVFVMLRRKWWPPPVRKGPSTIY